jgi:antitoxin HicB
MKNMAKNPHTGSSFDDFLAEDGILEECTATAIKRVLARQIEEEMKQLHLSKTAMAKRMKTSRSQLDRLLDADNTGITLEIMQRAASVVGRRLEVSLV